MIIQFDYSITLKKNQIFFQSPFDKIEFFSNKDQNIDIQIKLNSLQIVSVLIVLHQVILMIKMKFINQNDSTALKSQ